MTNPIDAAIGAVDDLQDELIETLVAAIRIESVTPTYPGESYDDRLGGESAVARLVAEVYQQSGAEVDVFAAEPGRENATGVIRGSGGGRSLLLNGHTDVVPAGDPRGWRWGEPFSGRVDDGYIYGRGAADMKAGLVAQAFAALALRRAGVSLRGDLLLQAVVGEEMIEPSSGTGAILERGLTVDAAIVGEPTGWSQPLQVMPHTAGILGFAVQVDGKASHAGNRGMSLRPGGEALAVNAVDKGFLVYSALRSLEDRWCEDKRHDLYPQGHFSLNPAIVEASRVGTPSPAFIPDRMTLVYGAFYAPDADADAIQAEVDQAVAVAAAEDPWLKDHPPVVQWMFHAPSSTMPIDHPLCDTMREARERACLETQLEGPAPVEGFPAFCDAKWLRDAGIPTISFGPGELAQAHSDDERCPLDQVLYATRAYALAAIAWCGT